MDQKHPNTKKKSLVCHHQLPPPSRKKDNEGGINEKTKEKYRTNRQKILEAQDKRFKSNYPLLGADSLWKILYSSEKRCAQNVIFAAQRY